MSEHRTRVAGFALHLGGTGLWFPICSCGWFAHAPLRSEQAAQNAADDHVLAAVDR